MRSDADESGALHRPLTLILYPRGEENPQSFIGAKAR